MGRSTNFFFFFFGLQKSEKSQPPRPLPWEGAGKKLLKQIWVLLFNLACMKITLFNLFCIELYANFFLALLQLSGVLFGIWGANSPELPCIFSLVGGHLQKKGKR